MKTTTRFNKYNRIAAIAAILLSMFFTVSCIREHLDPTNENQGLVNVKLDLDFPGMEEVEGTRSGPDDIITLIVMTFDASTGDMTDAPRLATEETVSGNVHRYVAPLKATTDSRRVVILVNSELELDAYLTSIGGTWKVLGEGGITTGNATQYSHVVANLKTFDLSTAPLGSTTYITKHPWDAPPMSGEVILASGIDPGTVIANPDSTPIEIKRTTAKFTVEVSNLITNFVIEGTSMGNAPRTGYILPQSGIVTISPLHPYAAAASTNETTGYQTMAGAVSPFLISDPIYSYEINKSDNPFVILKAKFNGVSGYYKINIVNGELADKATDRNPLDIVRNTWYHIKVLEVDYSGYTTITEARANPPSNIEYAVNAYVPTTGNNDDIIEDAHDTESHGAYFLGVSNSEFIYYNDIPGATSGDLHATTVTHSAPATVTTATVTVSSGLTISSASTGLTIQPGNTLAFFNPGTTKKFRIIVNMSSSFTTGKITIELGTIKKEILVSHRSPLSYVPGIITDFATGDYVTGEPIFVDPLNWPSWLKFSSSLSGSLPVSKIVNPTAGNIYLKYDANIAESGAIDRSAGVYLVHGNNKGRVKVLFAQSAFNANGTETRLANSYVGAFWRVNEIGERMIRINVGSATANTGEWAAKVTWLDGRWNGDYDKVVLSTGGFGTGDLSARGISWTSTQIPNDAEGFTVGGGETAVGGTVASNGYIEFRIGLQRHYTPVSGYPARYGVVTLVYGNNPVKYQKLYLRQGEGDDYLMRPGDKDGSGSNVGGSENRLYAAKFSPYNLTVPSGKTWNADVAYQGAGFTKYPTQAGALFQWANIGLRTRYAWDAFSTNKPNWESGANPVADFWTGGVTPLSNTHETCPPGYIRPSDGTTLTFNTTGDVAGSVIRQSLWLNPPTGWAAPSNRNLAWGYYADGFFDRRQIVTAPGALGEPASAVSITDENVAYAGGVFYNPNNNASLFFPAAGHFQGTLNYPGRYGNYITSSVKEYTTTHPINGRIWILGIDNDPLHSTNADAIIDYGYSIRCVVSTISASAKSIWMSPSPDNDSKTIQITSNDPWVVVSPSPTNVASISTTSGGAGTTSISMKRSATVFGAQSLIVKNTATGEMVSVLVDNYYIEKEELVFSNNAGLNTGEFELFVYGGNQKFTIVNNSWSSWIESATILPNGKLRVTAYQSPDGEPRTGSITLAHADDPTYTVTFTVIQDFDIIPPFQFLVLKFTWFIPPGVTSCDVDIAVEFTDPIDPSTPQTPNTNYYVNGSNSDATDPPNPIQFVNERYVDGGSFHRAVGFGVRQAVNLDGIEGTNVQAAVTNSSTLLIWGGDATGGQGETVFFKAPLITPLDPRNDNQNLPRYITLDAYAIWWTAGYGSNPVKLSVYTYDGGTMVKTGTNSAGNNLTPPVGYTGQLIYYTNFYNVPLGTDPADLLNGAASYALLNPPSSLVSKDLIVPRQATGRVQYFRNPSTGFTRLATITYDRYKRSATVTWHAAEYTGSIITPFGATLPSVPSLSQQQEADRLAKEKADALTH